MQENDELDEDVQALESAVVERDRLCELHGKLEIEIDSDRGRKI